MSTWLKPIAYVTNYNTSSVIYNIKSEHRDISQTDMYALD
jgi:hypothetical protein